MILQPIANIAEICARKSMKNIILSPGSRCAPLTIAFIRHPEIDTKTISDERSAAFIAIGIAQQIRHPAGLVCTSGSAAYNYAPAVAEAFFRHVPLVIFTADRPPEWVNQRDGQTIWQNEIYGKHVKASYQLPVSFEHADAQWHLERILSEAINTSRAYPEGPVHVNVPLREPLYPAMDEKINYGNKLIKVIESEKAKFSLSQEQWARIEEEWNGYPKKLIVAGQRNRNAEFYKLLNDIASGNNIPVVADVISNLHEIKEAITHQDIFLAGNVESLNRELQPDLLVTFGNSVISKNLKLFLRRYKPKAHWHIQPAGQVTDTFQSLTKVVGIHPEDFFNEIKERFETISSKTQEKYLKAWKSANTKSMQLFEQLFNRKIFGEFEAIHIIMKALPAVCNLHLANSMTVRYVNFIGLKPEQKDIQVFCNRGTSGIDGSSSTAVGTALASQKLNVLLTGDMAFFYDRNAFWHNYDISNLRVIILNNHAGGIFRLIDGSADQPELEEYFETRQSLNAQHTANDFGMEYLYCKNFEKLQDHLEGFFEESSKPKILEIETSSRTNKKIYHKYKTLIKNKYEV